MNISFKVLCTVALLGATAAATVSLAGPAGKDTFICCWIEK